MVAGFINVKGALPGDPALATEVIGDRHYLKSVLVGADGSPVDASALPVVSRGGQLRTYVATTGLGWTSYATPTEMFLLKGSNSKIVRVVNVLVLLHATAQTLMSPLTFYKRTAPNTGGSPAAATHISKLDSVNPDPTAVLDLYTAEPSAVGAGKALGSQVVFAGATTAAPGVLQLNGMLPVSSLQAFNEPVVLRGASEGLALNYNDQALPAGFTGQVTAIWTESDA